MLAIEIYRWPISDCNGLSVAATITDAESNFKNMKLLRAVGRYIAAFVFPLARLNRCLSSDMR